MCIAFFFSFPPIRLASGFSKPSPPPTPPGSRAGGRRIGSSPVRWSAALYLCCPINLLNFTVRQFPPVAGLKISQHNRSDGNPNESHRRMPHGGGHAPHLSVQALAQRDLQPGGRHVLAEPDRHRTFRQLRSV